jgi:hypothetical protein
MQLSRILQAGSVPGVRRLGAGSWEQSNSAGMKMAKRPDNQTIEGKRPPAGEVVSLGDDKVDE